MEKLELYRREIDKIDKDLAKLFRQRFELVEKIGTEKSQNGIAPLNTNRWEQVCLNWKQEFSNSKVSQKFINVLLNAVHEQSLEIERKIK